MCTYGIDVDTVHVTTLHLCRGLIYRRQQSTATDPSVAPPTRPPQPVSAHSIFNS